LFSRIDHDAIRRADKYLCLVEELGEDYLINELWKNLREYYCDYPEDQWYRLVAIFDWYFDKKILNYVTIRFELLPLIKKAIANHRPPLKGEDNVKCSCWVHIFCRFLRKNYNCDQFDEPNYGLV
jgi:hypothetical protein